MDILDQSGTLLFRIPEDWNPIFADRDLLAGANLREAQLTGTDFGNADLTGVCLARANLYQAFLNQTNLRHADLEDAILRGSDLEDADLGFANLKRADLSVSGVGGLTRLGGANLIGANLDGANLTGALYDSTTRFPDGFEPRSHGMLTLEEWQKAIEGYPGTTT